MPARLLLLDSASLYFRAFYGVPERGSDAPVPTNAVRGFADMIATLVAAHSPTDLVACWDEDWRPAFRTEAIASYKAHRVAAGGDGAEDCPPGLSPQVPVIRELLAAVGLCRLGVAGAEADDVIGTLATARRGSWPIDVVTGDRDLFQLVDDAVGIRVLYTARGGVRDPDVVDQSYLRQRYGVAGGEGYLDMSVLRGDPSDGLPGVPGIGEKTAAALIERYGGLAGLRAAVDGGDPELKGARRARLEAAAGYLDVAPRVVGVVRDLPLPPDLDTALPTAPADPDALAVLTERYALASPVRRLGAALGWFD